MGCLLSEQHRLKKAHIIPDTLDDFIPSCYLLVVYTSSHEVVRLGNRIKPSYNKKVPVVRILCSNTKADENVKSFTVALTDPDAPLRKYPEWREMCHWIVTVPIGGSILQEDETYWDENLRGARR
jgi:phosphatidylethanolamine-binding protein